MLVKCNCNHCPAHLEFDSSNAGTVVVCPKCGLETTLFIPTVKKPQPPQGLPIPALEGLPPALPSPALPPVTAIKLAPPGQPSPTRLSNLRHWGSQIVVALLAITGLLLILTGCSGALTEPTRESGSAIRQTVFAIQYGTGFILLGLGAILELLIAIARK